MTELGQQSREDRGPGASAARRAPGPERAIREYLEAQAGPVEVPAHNLLTSWGLERFDEDAVAVIAPALEREGISADPRPGVGLSSDAQVALQLLPPAGGALPGSGERRTPQRVALDLTALVETAHAALERLREAVNRLIARRRLAKLRSRYDERLRTFGGVVFELYEADARRPELIRRRVEELHSISVELVRLEERARPGHGGGVCGTCGLYCGDARFCLACGEEARPRPRYIRMSTSTLVIAVLLCTGAWMFGGIRPGTDGEQEVRPASQATQLAVSRGADKPAYRSLVAHARRRGKMPIHSRPGGKVSRRLDNPNADGAPLAFLIKRLRNGWAHVYLPARPNGSTGWIRLSDVTLSGHDYSVVINLTKRRLTAFRANRRIAQVAIGVGRAVTPTPTGLYYITELLKQPDSSGIYGPFAFGLSAYSNVLDEFAGADGILGIHGTNEPWAIGTDVSHGCIRVENRTITRLARTLPVGTPVRIRRA